MHQQENLEPNMREQFQMQNKLSEPNMQTKVKANHWQENFQHNNVSHNNIQHTNMRRQVNATHLMQMMDLMQHQPNMQLNLKQMQEILLPMNMQPNHKQLNNMQMNTKLTLFVELP